jgi:hypothetical protein
MPTSNSGVAKPKYFTLEEANKMLPLIKAIVADIVDQYKVVSDLQERLAHVAPDRRKSLNDVYTEEIAQSQAEKDAQETKLATYVTELTRLGVELKGLENGLCDFLSLRDGRPVYLCWRLGEPSIQHWHEIDAGFSGRQPISETPVGASQSSY